ncbi:MAG: ABC transporter permease [Actinomycetota bacterium]|nr:ABC transporter permease [Actinomycetota bacterium]
MFVGLRDLRHAWGRFTLMGSVIALVAVLTVLLTGLSTGLVNSGISGLRAMPLTDLAFQPKTNSTFSQSTLDAATIRSLGRQPGIQAEPLGLTFFNAKDAAGTSLSIALVGIEPGGFMAKGVAGGSQLGRTRTGVIVSRGVAADGVRVGGRITLDRSSVALHVVGIAPTATYGHVALVYAPIALWWQATYGQVTGGVLPASAQGLASAAALQVRPGTDVSAVGTHLGVDIVTKQQACAGSPGYVAETATMSLIIDFLYVIAALIVGAFFTVWTIQRKADIGLLKALGASNGLVIRDALGQVALVMAAATAAGALVGSGIGSLIPGGTVPFALQTGAIVTAAVILAVAGLVGSLVAVRRIAAVDPIIALGAAS